MLKRNAVSDSLKKLKQIKNKGETNYD